MFNFNQYKSDAYARLKYRGFIKDVMVVGGGLAIAQGIALAATPFISRLYGPESYGVAANFAALMNILSPLATFGYANAIVIPRDEREALAIAKTAVISCVSIAIVLLLVLIIFGNQLSELMAFELENILIFVIPASMLVVGLLSIANQAAIRAGHFKEKAVAYVGSAATTNAGKLIAGLLSPSALLLILMTEMGKLLNLALQTMVVPRQSIMLPKNWLGTHGVLNVANKYRDFPLYKMPQGVIRALAVGLPVILLTQYFNAGAAGQYSIVVLLLGAPVMLLGEAVGEALLPRIAKVFQEDREKAEIKIKQSMLLLAGIGSAVFGVIVVWGGELVPFLLGEGWEKAGEYSRWVSVWMLFMLLSKPVITIVIVMKMQRLLLIYEILVTAARVVALYVGAILSDDMMAVALFCMVNVAGYALLCFYVIKKIKAA